MFLNQFKTSYTIIYLNLIQYNHGSHPNSKIQKFELKNKFPETFFLSQVLNDSLNSLSLLNFP